MRTTCVHLLGSCAGMAWGGVSRDVAHVTLLLACMYQVDKCTSHYHDNGNAHACAHVNAGGVRVAETSHPQPHGLLMAQHCNQQTQQDKNNTLVRTHSCKDCCQHCETACLPWWPMRMGVAVVPIGVRVGLVR